MPVVLVSTQAEANIDSIAEYTKDTWGEIQADSYLMKLEDGFELLARSPFYRTVLRPNTTRTAPV